MDITKELNVAIELIETVNITNSFLLKGTCPDKAKEILFADTACLLLTAAETLEYMKVTLTQPTNIKVA